MFAETTALDLESELAPTSSGAAIPLSDRRGPFRPHTLSPARLRLSGALLQRVFQSVDAAVVLALTLFFLARSSPVPLLARPIGTLLPLSLGAVVSLAALRSLSAYRFTAREPVWNHLLKLVGAFVISGALTVVMAGALDRTGSARFAASWTLSTWAAIGVAHIWARLNVRRWRIQGRLTPNIVVVGATPNAARMINAARQTQDVAVLGIFDDRVGRVPASLQGVPVLGDTQALLDHKIIPFVDRIVITVTAASQTRIRELIARLRMLPNSVTLFLDVGDETARASVLSRLADLPLAQVSGHSVDERRAVLKRVQDVVLGGLLLILAAPLMLAIAIAIKLDSRGPILFCQRRHGFNNEAITICKFRSMRHEAADPSASRQVCVDDERITRVGRFIRSTSLDELPQLLNVLKGEMSLVGPRPHAIGMKTGTEESARLVAEYAWRHRMKPGITGWAQINGSRGPVDTPMLVRRRVSLDIEYIERQSFWFDLYILAVTLPCLLGDKHLVR